MDLLKIQKRTNSVLNTVTVSMLSLVTLGALKIRDLSFVLAFAGASLGNALIYIFPALMFRSAVKQKADATPALKKEVNVALTSGAMGLIMGILGMKMALQTIM